MEVICPNVDNALYSIAFGTHTRTPEPIEMPLGMMSGLGPRNSVLYGVTIPKREGAILEENVPDKPNTPMHCELDSGMLTTRAYA